jgi:hypothetical protein
MPADACADTVMRERSSKGNRIDSQPAVGERTARWVTAVRGLAASTLRYGS